MVGGNRIIAFGSGGLEASAGEPVHEPDQAPPACSASMNETPSELVDPDDMRPVSSRYWILPLFTCLAIAAWTAVFSWLVHDRFLASGPAEWLGMIRDWTTPVLLIAIIALFVFRGSRRESLRFGDAARMLSEESARLELRLSTVNRELSLAREFLASQSRDLEALGRLASERLSREADRLQSLVRDNHDRIEAIGTVSEAALDNMEKLRGQLPVIASSAKDVTNNIGTAGRTAHSQLQDMINGFQRLNDFGTASERQVQAFRDRVDEAVAEFMRQAEQLDGIATTRFAVLAERSAEFRTQLEREEVEVLTAIRSRSAAMAEELDQIRQKLDGHEAESLTSLRARLSALRDEGATISRSLRESESRAIENWHDAIRSMTAQMDEAMAAVDAGDERMKLAIRASLDDLAADSARFEAQLLERSQAFEALAAGRDQTMRDLDARAIEAFSSRLDQLDAELTARETRAMSQSDEAIARLMERLAELDSELDNFRAQHEHRSTQIAAHGESVIARLGDVEQRLSQIAQHGSEAGSTLDLSLTLLTDRLAASRQTLAGAGDEIAGLTEAAVRLLELIQASAQHSRDELPHALAAGEGQLVDIEQRVAALRETVNASRVDSEMLAGHVENASSGIAALFGEIELLQAKLTEGGAAHSETIAALQASLESMEGKSRSLAAQANDELSVALAKLMATAQDAIAEIEKSGSGAVSGLAQQLGEESTASLERVMRNSVAEITGQLEQAAAHAAGVSREAAIQLRDQLTKVNELAANLENRVAHARQRAEEQVDNDFTRRIALITESLNSNAIDIAKALSTEVSDTAWNAYLKGNRSIFTRRAVSLLESAEAKSVAQIYERDRDFHEHVSRYIHDFEAMLRQVLSARDGNALGVTLLSSDMGKLYVALAQAIERLRS